MEIVWLEDFLALSSLRVFGRAAEARNISQPAFTRRIKNLENWIGTPLFDRSVHPVTLTVAGEGFRKTATDVLDTLLTAKGEARDLSTRHGEIVEFVALHTLAISYFPRWIRDIEQSLGELKMRVKAENFSSCVESVLSGSSDFMLCYDHPTVPTILDDERYPSQTLAHDRLIAVCAPNSRGRPLFNIKKETRFPYLGYTAESFLGRITEYIHEKSKLSENAEFRHENSSSEALKASCIAGLGIAWLPTIAVQKELEKKTLVKVSAKKHETDISIKLHRSIERSRSEIERLWSLSEAQSSTRT